MIIDIQPDLIPSNSAYYRYANSIDDVLHLTIPPQLPSRKAQRLGADVSETERLVRSSLPSDAAQYHSNYLLYLVGQWAQHHSIVLNPDIVWFAVLNEIAKGVVAMPDAHQALFTRSPDPITIMVMVQSADEPLPLDAILAELTTLVPVDVNLFVPRFSTTEPMARLSHLASFAETCTPYYSYMTYMCGFPRIRIDGGAGDYDLAVGRAVAIFNELDRIGSPLAPWMASTMLPWLSNIADAVHKQDASFFHNMLATERCGSGGEIEVSGWWTKLFRDQPTDCKPMNFPTQIARVPWTNKETERQFTLNCGVFYSLAEAGFMNPQFGWVQNELV